MVKIILNYNYLVKKYETVEKNMRHWKINTKNLNFYNQKIYMQK